MGFLLPGLGIAICFLETTYPFIIWAQQTRKAVLYSICVMHLGVGILMGMYLFAGIMIVLNVAAFWPGEGLSRMKPASSRQETAQDAT